MLLSAKGIVYAYLGWKSLLRHPLLREENLYEKQTALWLPIYTAVFFSIYRIWIVSDFVYLFPERIQMGWYDAQSVYRHF
jgi:hypothetical protein